MNALPDISLLASMIGDPARSSMLDALMDGRALTAKELAYYGGITPQTASSHLAKLSRVGLIAQERFGRNRYFRLANARVAEALEAMMVLAADRTPRRQVSAAFEQMRTARTCYDHLAGSLGVALTAAMVDQGWLVPSGRDFDVTPQGQAFLGKLGVDLAAARKLRRAFARQCLDWTERRVHLAGALGASFAALCFARDWVLPAREGRALQISTKGRRAFVHNFGVRLDDLAS
jgi:DNA-binding transcriptional ArsR family regulator